MPVTRSRWLAGLVCLSAFACTPVPDSAARQTGQESPLTDSVWFLAELGGNSITLPPSMRLLDLRFHTSGLLTGFTGCNFLTGRYEATDSRLDFREPLSTTPGPCPTSAMTAQERALLDALRRTSHYEFAGTWLNLYADTELLARFVSAPGSP